MGVNVQDMNRRVRVPTLKLSGQPLHRLAYALTAILALTALYLVLSATVTWGQARFDDLRYGTPRMFHMSADVGHGGGTGAPSHMIAVNLDRQVMVIDIPGGDMEQVRVLPGPYLFGTGEDMTPVTMHLEDMNRDSHADLILQIKDEEIIYLNRDGSFSLMSEGERQRMLRQNAQQ